VSSLLDECLEQER